MPGRQTARAKSIIPPTPVGDKGIYARCTGHAHDREMEASRRSSAALLNDHCRAGPFVSRRRVDRHARGAVDDVVERASRPIYVI